MKNSVLLVGNGINNIDTTYTWSDLIADLIQYIGAKERIQIIDKPFPLLYEEIVAWAIKENKIPEIEIKQFITEQIQQLAPNEIHRRVMAIKVQHVLTTNYDFTLEQVFNNQTYRLKNEGVVKESLYSVFRHHSLGDKQIWHIHGDRNHLSSITLGYEHYSGYLQQMRNYIATGASYTNLKLDPLIKRIKAGGLTETYSWLDFFFTKNIYIIGLTMDFIEIHLWWLLTYRQRTIRTPKICLKNSITYFYPDLFEDAIKHKLQLLNSYEVKTIPVQYDQTNGMNYYLRILNQIEDYDLR